MKTSIPAIGLTALVVIAFLSSALHAQSTALEGGFNIPFSFDCGDAHLSPGVYILTIKDGRVLTLRSSRNYTVMAIVRTGYGRRSTETSQASFEKYGDRYFLREIRIGGSLMTSWVNESSSEKRAAREFRVRGQAGTQVALTLLPVELHGPGN
jgi:hypothetical protein